MFSVAFFFLLLIFRTVIMDLVKFVCFETIEILIFRTVIMDLVKFVCFETIEILILS